MFSAKFSREFYSAAIQRGITGRSPRWAMIIGQRQKSSSASSSSSHHLQPLLPDLSHPKWARREKLNAMNFMNKGKSGFRQRKRIVIEQQPGDDTGVESVAKPILSKKQKLVEKRRQMRSREQLPAIKTSQQKLEREYSELYAAVCRLPDTLAITGAASAHDMQKIPGSISWEKLENLHVPLLGESDLSEVKQLAAIEKSPPLLPLGPSSSAPDSVIANSPKIHQTPLNELVLQQFNETSLVDELAYSQTRELRDVLYLNSKLGRVAEAQRTFDLMQQQNIQPNTFDFNALMNAYATADDMEGTKRVFTMLTANSSPAVADAYSYGILIKALSKRSKVSEAFKTYELMKERGVQPTLPIFTSLIQTCKRVGDANRAWALFDHYRLRVGNLDNIIVNSMLDLCAKSGQVERAMALYRDLLRAPISAVSSADGMSRPSPSFVPTITTYSILIHACAKRKEFYRDMFDLVQRMQAAGIQPTRETYNYLLMGCANNGDIERAKALWAEMLEKSISDAESSLLVPNRQSYLFMLSCYSRVPTLIEDIWRRTTWKEKMDKFDRKVLEAKMGLDNEERMKKGLKPLDINEWALSDDSYQTEQKMELVGENDPELKELRDYMLQGKSEEERIEESKQEALGFFQALLSRFRTPAPNTTEHAVSTKVSTAENVNFPGLELNEHILNAYIDVLGAFNMKRDAFEVYDKLFPEFKLHPNGMTFARLMNALTKPKLDMKQIERQLDEMIAEGSTNTESQDDDADSGTAGEEAEFLLEANWKAFKSFEKYRRLRGFPEKWSELEGKFSREKWQERGITHADRKHEYLVYKYMIRGLVEFNDLNQSVKLLQTLIDRDHARVTNIMAMKPNKAAPLSKSPVNASDSPAYVMAPVEFRTKDFYCLLNRARDMGNKPVMERVEQLLQRATKQLNLEQQKNLARMQRIKKQAKAHRKGVTLDTK